MHAFALFVAVFVVAALTPAVAWAQKCDARRMDAAGKHLACVLSAQSKAVRSDGTTPDAGEPKCGSVFASKWSSATAQGDCSAAVAGEEAFDLSQQNASDITELLAPDAEDLASVCASLQIKAAGKYAACRLKVERGALTGKPLDFSRCDSKFVAVFTKAEAAGDCLTGADGTSAVAEITGRTDAMVALILGTATTTTTAPTTTTTPTSTTLPADTFSDDFEGTGLDASWSILHPEMATVSVNGGRLLLQVDVTGNWYQTQESVLVHKLITGDFDVRSTVRVARTSNPAQPPAAEYRLGGILARDPASTPGNSNFVHVAVGAGSFAVPMAAEWKSTDDSSSAYDFTPLAQTEAELRLTRTGNVFAMYYRVIGAMTWELLHSQMRSDLPATMQVGLMAYDPNGVVNITASFDEITLVE